MKLFLLVLALLSCGHASPSDSAAVPPGPPAQNEAAQGQPCDQGACRRGLMCVEFEAPAGGAKRTSCEIPCAAPGAQCPNGQRCVTIADGPGTVCRPAPTE